MLRSTDLSSTHQIEVSSLSNIRSRIRFRFSEKRRPGHTTMWSEWLTNSQASHGRLYPANLSSKHLRSSGCFWMGPHWHRTGCSIPDHERIVFQGQPYDSHGKAGRISETIGDPAVADGAIVRDAISRRTTRRGLYPSGGRSKHCRSF
jgi:hypothetical protein